MNTIKKNLIRLIFLALSGLSYCQVGVNTTTPHASSALEIVGTNKGLLIPRIPLTSKTDTATIPDAATSLMVYNTNNGADITTGYYYWNGTEWIRLIDTPTRLFKGNTNPTATNPANSIAGDVYVNSTTGVVFAYNGTNWISQQNGVNMLTAELVASDGQTEFTTPWEVSASNTKVYRNGVSIRFEVLTSNSLKIETEATCYSNDEIKILKFL